MINKAKIEGFRGIKNLEIDDFKRINLFVGDNNCGKTTILESLFILANPSNPKLPLNTNLFRNYKETGSNALKMFFNNLDIDKSIKLYCETSNPEEKRDLTIKANKKTSNQMIKKIDKEHQEMKFNNLSNTQKKYEINGLTFDFKLTKSNNNTKKFESEIISHNNGFEINPPRKKYEETLSGVFNSKATMKKENLSNRFDSIQIKKKKKGIIEILQDIEPKLEDLTIGSRSIVYADIGLNHLIPINSLGNGIIKLLYIISSIADNANGIVLIDEVENGFHYSSQETLWKAILDATKEFNVQLFATTHSLETIKALSSIYSEKKNENNEELIRLYRIEKKNDQLRSTTYNYEELKTTLKKGWDVR